MAHEHNPEGPNQFSVQEQHHMMVDTSSIITGLTPGHIYVMMGNPERGIYIDKLSEGFTFPDKVYGTEEKFIEHVLTSWNASDTNMGVLGNGIQGAGKTVTMKQLATRANMPIILITANFGKGMIDYFGALRQDVVVFIDEYEKIFANMASAFGGKRDGEQEDSTLLTLMDGVMKTKFRRLFLLTTNQEYINVNMQQRPGRIRYKKQFGNLNREVIEEIVDDKLQNKELRGAVISFIAKLQMISIDIVTSVVGEVNIHNCDPEEFSDIFNVKKNEDRYDLLLIQGDGSTITLEAAIKPKYGTTFGEMDSVGGASMTYGYAKYQDEETGDIDVELNTRQLLRHRHLGAVTDATLRFQKVVGYHESYRGYAD